MYLERLLAIVETISSTDTSAAMTVSEIAAATGVPKPSIYRQVNDLVDAGLLEPRENGRYAVGVRARRLSGQNVMEDVVKQMAVPLLKTAARDTGVAVFLSRLSGASVEILHAEVPLSGVSYLHPGIGARPLHACSCGKAISAFSEDAALSQKLSGRLRAYTDHTKIDYQNITSEFQIIKSQGYAECVEELEQGVCSVAAPVKLSGQPVRYSLGATGTLRIFTASFRNSLGQTLISLCNDLSHMLGDRHESTAQSTG